MTPSLCDTCGRGKGYWTGPDEPPCKCELPVFAVWSGEFTLFGAVIQCHTLSDGRRIIEADSMRRLIDAMIDGPGTAEDSMGDPTSLLAFMQWRQQ